MSIWDTIKISKLKKLLRAYNFEESHKTGSHSIWKRKDLPRPLVIPVHSKEVPFYVIQEVRKILNLSPKEFIKVLNRFK